MHKYFAFVLLLLVTVCNSQIIPNITIRVDTTNTEVKKVYNLYKDYLNSRPDSVYVNPHWNRAEVSKYLDAGMPGFDDSFMSMFSGDKAEDFLHFYKPKVLQIDKVNNERYLIKTQFSAFCEDEAYRPYNPLCVTRLYAVKNATGDFKLENAKAYDTRNWKRYKYKNITYVVHPDCIFHKAEAKKAVKFCADIASKFNLEKMPQLTYYLTGDSDAMGKLFNYEYWTSYTTGITNTAFGEIYTAYGNEHFPHELVHLMFPGAKDDSYRPMIINEGIATWLAGAGKDESFDHGLKKLSAQLKDDTTVTIDRIISFDYHNPYDNDALYVTGGVICKMVYDEHGIPGINKLLKSPKDDAGFKKLLEELFGMPYAQVNDMVMGYIKEYNSINKA